MPFKRILETINICLWMGVGGLACGGGGGGGGGDLPWVKCPPPNPHVFFHFYIMIKGIEKSLVT